MEAEDPAVVDDAVDDRGGHVPVAEHVAPSAELEVRGEDDPAVPVPALGSGERPGHQDTQPGVSVNPGPGMVAVGGRSVRCRASMSSS